MRDHDTAALELEEELALAELELRTSERASERADVDHAAYTDAGGVALFGGRRFGAATPAGEPDGYGFATRAPARTPRADVLDDLAVRAMFAESLLRARRGRLEAACRQRQRRRLAWALVLLAVAGLLALELAVTSGGSLGSFAASATVGAVGFRRRRRATLELTPAELDAVLAGLVLLEAHDDDELELVAGGPGRRRFVEAALAKAQDARVVRVEVRR